MVTKLKIALAAALVVASASAALARSHNSQAPRAHDWQYYSCQSDEGYGRTLPCEVGG